MMHGNPKKIDVLDSIIAEATAPGTDALQGLSTNDREDISKLFLEVSFMYFIFVLLPGKVNVKSSILKMKC